MPMKKLYNYAKGTARLEIKGAEPERLLNLCAEKEIEFFDAGPKEDYCIRMTVYAKDYPEIEKSAAKCGCAVRLINEVGGRLILKNLKARAALLIALSVCLSLLIVSSLFVWDIEVCGNNELSDGEILRALSDCGFSEGCFWPGLATDSLRSKMQIKLPEIGWMSVNIHNSRAVVEIKERIKKPEIENRRAVNEIKAKNTGVIKKLSVLEGNPLVKVGDAVVEGDVLVSAVMESETAPERYVAAKAVIEAETNYEISGVCPLVSEQISGTHAAHRSFAVIFGKKVINFFSGSRNNGASCDRIIKYRSMSIGHVFTFPIALLIDSSRAQDTEPCAIDEKAAAERIKNNLLEYLQSEIDGSITEKSFSVSKTDELLVVTLHATCLENIALTEEYYND